MTRTLLIAAIVCATVACRPSETATTPTPTPAAPSPLPIAPKRVLVVTHTTGFRHPSIATAETVLNRLADSSGLFRVVFSRDEADVKRLLSTAALADVDAVFFANTTGDLGIPDVPAFLAWIRAGHAFVGAHSASDTYHGSRDYLDMLGAEFDTHGDETRVDITVEDRGHPAGAALPSPFSIVDEIYEFRTNPRRRVNVLLSLDRHPTDGHAAAGQPGDFPLAWSHAYGDGRVFYTALGHRDDVWTDARFQQHILGAIRWALKL